VNFRESSTGPIAAASPVGSGYDISCIVKSFQPIELTCESTPTVSDRHQNLSVSERNTLFKTPRCKAVGLFAAFA
jgi:hypothetical protein